METPEEFVGSNDQIHGIMPLKGPRTKRLRLNYGGADVTSSSSSGGGGDQDQFASSSVSGEAEISTEEEEDMANCLILLAQGEHGRRPRQFLQEGVKIERISTKRFNFDVYECRTCNRTFPSFQALGGHRASHKKPKPTTAEEPEEPHITNKILQPPAATVLNKPTVATVAVGAKIHECSICGLEFTSGQALGGHMRRHRAAVSSAQQVTATNTEHHRHHHNHSSSSTAAPEMKGRNILELDLNLPAPEEDLRDTKKFQFKPTPQTIVFSAPALVDCHY